MASRAPCLAPVKRVRRGHINALIDAAQEIAETDARFSRPNALSQYGNMALYDSKARLLDATLKVVRGYTKQPMKEKNP